MSELRFYRHPVDAPLQITGGFGDWYYLKTQPYRHRGVDYGKPRSSAVYAPAPGTTVKAYSDGSFGTNVCIDHHTKPWRYSLYAHLEESYVGIGERVETGQLIGRIGRTGFVTGYHLHWQVSKLSSFPVAFSESADPLQFLVQEDEPMTPEEKKRMAALEHLVSQIARSGWGTKGGSLLESTVKAKERLDENDRAMPAGEVGSTAERMQEHFEDEVQHGH